MNLLIQTQTTYEDFTLCLDAEFSPGSTAILGPSGCGKSLTLKTIAGLTRPQEGRIVHGQEVYFDHNRRLFVSPQHRKVGYLFQNYALFPHLTVEENIGFALRKGARRTALVDQYCKSFQIEHLKNKRPGEISGGQQQRVALARLFAYDPDILLLDEPFSALDAQMKQELYQELYDVIHRFSGITLLVTHDKAEAYDLSSRLFLMDQGHILRRGATQEVFQCPHTLREAEILGYQNISPVKQLPQGKIHAVDWNLTYEGILAPQVTHVAAPPEAIEAAKEPFCDDLGHLRLLPIRTRSGYLAHEVRFADHLTYLQPKGLQGGHYRLDLQKLLPLSSGANDA
ncbi:Molybdenum transport ATP-binding protein ModC [Clostridiaceae bacterium JG1575]|nr:Molybdenum transport ATP-binding protein ModC [Clostridiaceae bacterium JG1575]